MEAKRIFTSKVVTNPEFQYEFLAKQYFSPNLLPACVFCPKHPGLDDGDLYAERMTSFCSGKGEKGRLPAFACQATFIPGGLVLSVWFYHAIVDGAGNARILVVWSTAVRALSNEATSIPRGPMLD